MALVSISEAARLAGIARSHFYKSYINTGRVSITKDSKGRPKVDTSEVMRVFGVLSGRDTRRPERTKHDRTEKPDDTGRQDELVALLKQQLQEAKAEAAEREQWYRQQVEDHIKQIGELTSTIKQLEYKPPAPFWQNWFK